MKLTFTSDEYFHIGERHLGSGMPCQDYAVSDAGGSWARFALSDGCSTGRRTDVGARLLTLATCESLRNHSSIGDTDVVVRNVRKEQEAALYVSKQLYALKQGDLLATSLYGRFDAAGGFIHIEGDGVVAFAKRDGSIAMHRYEWAHNTPYYPAYRLGDEERYVEAMGGDLQAIALTCESWNIGDDFCTQDDTREYTVQEGMRGITHQISAETLEEIAFVAIFSDGVTQVDGTDWREATQIFLRFKRAQGVFAKRRMARGIGTMQKTTKGPIDDIAYAVIHIQQEEESDDNHRQANDV